MTGKAPRQAHNAAKAAASVHCTLWARYAAAMAESDKWTAMSCATKAMSAVSIMLETILTPVSVKPSGAKGRRRKGLGRTGYLLCVQVGEMPA